MSSTAEGPVQGADPVAVITSLTLTVAKEEEAAVSVTDAATVTAAGGTGAEEAGSVGVTGADRPGGMEAEGMAGTEENSANACTKNEEDFLTAPQNLHTTSIMYT